MKKRLRDYDFQPGLLEPGTRNAITINAVVGETNDGLLNAIHRDVISKEDVLRAWENRCEDFELGCVGAGTGTMVLATDAPLTARQLERLASRAFLGLARTGSVLANGSGDYAID